MPGSIEELTTATLMKRSAEQHEQTMRAHALNCSVMLLAADTKEVEEILKEADHMKGLTGTRRLELLANHLLTYIETGQFLDHG